MKNCAWSKWSEMPTNPDGAPGDCVAQYRDLGESTDLPQGFHRVTTIEQFHAHVDAHRAALVAHDALMEWKTVVAPAAIDAEAQRRIILITGGKPEAIGTIPSWVIRQINLQAAHQELLTQAVTLSSEAQPVSDALVAMWAKVKAVRAYSNELKARAAGGETFDVLTQPWPY